MDDATWETLMFANLAREHNWPVGGGMLDQSKWFVDAARFVWWMTEKAKD